MNESYLTYSHDQRKDVLKNGMKITYQERVCVNGFPSLRYMEDTIIDILGFSDFVKVSSGKEVALANILEAV